MSSFIANSEESLQRTLGDLRGLWQQHKYLRINVKAGKDRSGEQNRILHAWFGQLARELPENDALAWKSFCKLHYGVPIMRAEDEEFRVKYDAAVKPMSYGQKLIIMEFWPVSSVMTIPQLSKLLQATQAGISQRGVQLTFPEE